jgi:hypothetical protein
MSVEKVKEKYPKWEDTSEFYTWQQVWVMVITRPSTATFEEILRDPQANADRGYRWVFWTGLSVFVITFLFLATRFGVFDIPSLLCMLAVGAILPTIAFGLMCGMILGYFLLNRANGTGMVF